MWGCFSSPPLHQHNHVIKYLSSILHNISIFTKSLAYKPPFLHVSIQPIQVTKTDLYIAINPNQCSLPFNYKVISLLHTLTRISIYPTQTCHTCMHQPHWCIYTHTHILMHTKHLLQFSLQVFKMPTKGFTCFK